jgi:ring-1,2-phenylacetyl-CoA epoxidase subunit PaaB
MTSTQWSRFQVFVQAKPGEAHQDAGTVHAPDAELALLNARDVFARRPECVSMWVVPATAIYSKTAEEIQNLSSADGWPPDSRSATPETYYVACKHKQAGTQTLVGSVEAAGPPLALAKAIEKYAGGAPVLVWWVFPARAVTQSDPAEIDSLYAPAKDKGFRMSTDFHTHTAMRKLKVRRLKVTLNNFQPSTYNG